MAGIVGTALMLAECSGCGFDIDLQAVPVPPGVDLARWLRTFPSFGFLLSVRPECLAEVCSLFAARDIHAAAIGRATTRSSVDLTLGEERATFWDHAASPYLSLSKENVHA